MTFLPDLVPWQDERTQTLPNGCIARDYERLPETLAGLHFVVFSVLMLVHFAALNKSA